MITNGNNTTQRTIVHLCLEDMYAFLKFCMPMSGVQSAEMPLRTEQSNNIVGHLNTTHMTPTTSWILYLVIYVPKIFFH